METNKNTYAMVTKMGAMVDRPRLAVKLSMDQSWKRRA